MTATLPDGTVLQGTPDEVTAALTTLSVPATEQATKANPADVPGWHHFPEQSAAALKAQQAAKPPQPTPSVAQVEP